MRPRTPRPPPISRPGWGLSLLVTSLMAMRADARHLEFGVEFIGAIPEVIISDPTRLKQILVNRVGNAITFTETGGVRLITRRVDDGVEPRMQFDVVDTEIGMTANQVVRLFQPFTKAIRNQLSRPRPRAVGQPIASTC
jgi:signal transduction histidine kinase